MSAYEWLQYRRTLPLHPRTLITRRHRDQFIAAYRAHYARAQQDISPARLLAMDIHDPQKSEKLSAFFGLRDEIPFPHCMPASQAKPWIKSLRSLRHRMFGSDLHHASLWLGAENAGHAISVAHEHRPGDAHQFSGKRQASYKKHLS